MRAVGSKAQIYKHLLHPLPNPNHTYTRTHALPAAPPAGAPRGPSGRPPPHRPPAVLPRAARPRLPVAGGPPPPPRPPAASPRLPFPGSRVLFSTSPSRSRGWGRRRAQGARPEGARRPLRPRRCGISCLRRGISRTPATRSDVVGGRKAGATACLPIRGEKERLQLQHHALRLAGCSTPWIPSTTSRTPPVISSPQVEKTRGFQDAEGHQRCHTNKSQVATAIID